MTAFFHPRYNTNFTLFLLHLRGKPVLFLMLICLFPVALYLAVLSTLNRREHPLLVAGTWDFAWALLASSGFLLVAGPAILACFLSRPARSLLLRLDGRHLPILLSELGGFGLGPWLVYYGGLLLLIVALLLWRRSRSVVYNVDPDQFEQILHEALQRRGLTSHGTRLDPLEAASNEEKPSLPVYPGGSEQPLVQVERFDSMCHVTLHWSWSTPITLRREIETELIRALRGVPAPDNPAAGWLLGVSTGMFGILTVTALVVIIGTMIMAGR